MKVVPLVVPSSTGSPPAAVRETSYPVAPITADHVSATCPSAAAACSVGGAGGAGVVSGGGVVVTGGVVVSGGVVVVAAGTLIASGLVENRGSKGGCDDWQPPMSVTVASHARIAITR